jgi:hypothetical protein
MAHLGKKGNQGAVVRRSRSLGERPEKTARKAK